MALQKTILSCLLLILHFSITETISQTNPVAFVGAKIIPISGEPIENGTLIIQNGKIINVGSSEVIELSSNTEVINVSEKVIMPGLVDTHSHIGERYI
jgi:imidazolonepropionase-like amidohydrolase